jgi:hypothetical protein
MSFCEDKVLDLYYINNNTAMYIQCACPGGVL